MASFYALHRDFSAKKWIHNFIIFMFFAYYAANVAFMVPFYAFSSQPNSKGKYVDMWATGLMIYILCVWFTHAIFVVFIRHWSQAMIAVALFVYVQWVIVAAVVNAGV